MGAERILSVSGQAHRADRCVHASGKFSEIILCLWTHLKPGKARFFETLVTDANTAAFSQLFSYFKAGYRQCLSLRIRLWCKRILLFTLCSLPAMLTLYVMQLATAAGEELIGGVLFLVSAFLTVIALVITEIRMFRYLPALYLLPYTEKAATALRVSRKLEGNTTDLWTRLYLDYAGWCFSFLLIFPFFYAAPLFHTARADTAYRLISHNAPRIQKLLLKQP